MCLSAPATRDLWHMVRQRSSWQHDSVIGYIKFLQRLMVASLAAMLLGAPAQAQLPTPGKNAIAASLVAESPVVVPGQTATLALVMRPDKGWHGYWKNPGDSGIETQIAWTLPAGLTAGPIQYPVPGRLIIGGLMNYVYEGDYAQLIDVKVPADIAPGTKLPLRAKVDYLACTDDVCVPETANVAVELQAGSAAARRPTAPCSTASARRCPSRSAARRGSRSPETASGWRSRFPPGWSIAEPYFFPLTDGALAYAAEQSFSRAGDTLIVETDAPTERGEPRRGRRRAEAGRRQWPVAEGGAGRRSGRRRRRSARRAGRDRRATAVLAALLGAVLGGLLLNIMPCVFPILSLKALSLAKAGGDEARREARSARLYGRRGADLPRARRRVARACGRAEPRPAGRSSCRTRASSWCCCC